MPREVFAGEIEEFLERLEGVLSARVIASQEGEIERIYLTAEGQTEVPAIRRSVVSALMSQFSIPIEGWRIQVARLRDDPLPLSERVAYRLHRFTETLTEAQVQVTVELRYEVDGEVRTASGTSKGSPGFHNRLRVIAQAAFAALRQTLSQGERNLTVEAVTVVPIASREVVLVALVASEKEGEEVLVGAAPVMTSLGEAVVNALLDAASKRVVRTVRLREGMEPMDRRERLEAMRRYYQRVVKGPMRFEGTSLSPGEQGDGEGRAALAEAGFEEKMGEDTIADITDIRPEKEGGAAMTAREISERHEPQPPRPSPKSAMEDAYYQRLVDTAAPVYIRCVDGYEIRNAVFKGYGTYAVLVEVGGVEELLFKHGIISIRPEGPLPVREVGEA
ncbi:MAG: hypothetical protein QN121_03130 [Armatimonadota bacterium]|nr:hypothetical protein [Armatimonadota bacterium]